MADNFNLRSFLTENKLTKNAKILKEGSDYGYDAVIDAIADHFDEGSYEYDQVLKAVEQAFHNNEIDTSDFSHNINGPSEVVLSIANQIGLGEYENDEPSGGSYVSSRDIEEDLHESTLSPREKYLTRLVENALEMTPQQLPVSEEEMVQEKPLPKYESIDQLMQEIEHGTNEAAYKHKMAKMKEVAEMLEARVSSLEEGDGAEFVDTKKVKQMKKDIMTLRKQAEKLEKEYDKKFGEKKAKKEQE